MTGQLAWKFAGMNKVNAYIQSIPDHRRDRSLSIHNLILNIYPDVSVDMSYKMPTYRAVNGWAALANQKNYISLYTCAASHLEAYKQKHPEQKTGKGCITTGMAMKSTLMTLKQ